MLSKSFSIKSFVLHVVLMLTAWSQEGSASHIPNYPKLDECIALGNRRLRVAAVHDNQVVYLNATFGEYLSRFLVRHGCEGGSELVVQSHQVMFPIVEDTVANPQAPGVDFVFGDPGTVTVLQRFYPGKLQLLSTILRVENGAVTSQLGGVLVRRADAIKASRLNDWPDIADPTLPAANLSLCAIESDSFSGWQIQNLESVFQIGERLEHVFKVSWLKHESDVLESNDEVLDAVFDGLCDIGAVATGTLERLASSPSLYSGRTIPLNTWKVVGALTPSAAFPVATSTRLYPQWGLLALGHVPPKITSVVKMALEAMWDDEPAAVLGKNAGFTLPADYTEAAVVEFHLDVDGDGTCMPGWERDQQTGDNHVCIKCAAGHFATGSEPCEPCLPSYYQDEEGSTKCKKCPKGYSSFEDGATACVVNENISFLPIQACNNYKNNTLIIAVMADETQSNNAQDAMWRPAFDKAVNAFINRYNCYVEMIILPFEDLHHAVENKEIDFIFLDGGEYSQLRYRYQLQALAMVLRNYQGFSTAHEGGVIFRHASSVRTVNMSTIEDVARVGAETDLTVCLTHKDSFTGWAVQEYEFFKRGFDIHEVFKEIRISGNDEITVQMVMEGICDVGMVQTYAIERMDHLSYKPEDFAIINEQHYDHFALRISTPLYAQWPFAALNHVEDDIAQHVVLPLLNILEGDEAAVQAHIGGFVSAPSYENESIVNFHLNLMDPDTEVCFPGSMRAWESKLQPCQLCPAGFHSTDGHKCHPCGPDFYTDRPGMAECLWCGDGYISYDFGSTSCRKEEDVLTYQPIQACSLFHENTLVVGVLSEVSKEQTVQLWHATFEDALNDYFNRYQCWFRMEALNWHEVDRAVQNKEIDFLFADAGLYMQYHNAFNATALASVLRIFNGHMAPWYGGVMVRNASKHADIHTLQDLYNARDRNLVACPVDEGVIGGWNAQQYEFFKAKMDIKSVFAKVVFSHSHGESVEMMRRGECDVALVRTNTLEEYIAAEEFELSDVVVINRRYHENFIAVISTDLFPEWPFVALSHVPSELSSVAATPLLAMREYHKAAVQGSHAGFSSSLSYEPVAEVRYQLAMEPGGSCGAGAYRQMQERLQPCALCPAGKVNPNGIGDCLACPAGSISAREGGESCKVCPFGFFTQGSGSTECVERHDVMQLSYGVQIVVWVLAALAVGFCVLVCALVLKHRNTKLIKASSFKFNVILILASAVVCASTVLFSFLPGPDNVVCSLRWWLPCLSASTVFGTLFSKTFRLYKIFRIYEVRQKIPSSIKFKDTKVAAMVLAFQAATALVLMIFFLVDPPFYYLDRVTVEGQAFETYVDSCHVSESWLAFRVRKLPTVFNESQLIAWLLYNTVFVGLVAIMVDALLDTMQGTALMMVRTLALFLGALTTVFVLYVPKLLEIYRNSMNDSKYSSKDSARTKGNTTNEHDTVDVAANASAVHPSKPQSHPTSRVDGNNSDLIVPLATKQRVDKQHRSQMSAISGLSDDGQEGEDFQDFKFDVVPSSDIAGDEGLQVSSDEYRVHIDKGAMPVTARKRSSASEHSQTRDGPRLTGLPPSAIPAMREDHTGASFEEQSVQRTRSKSSTSLQIYSPGNTDAAAAKTTTQPDSSPKLGSVARLRSSRSLENVAKAAQAEAGATELAAVVSLHRSSSSENALAVTPPRKPRSPKHLREASSATASSMLQPTSTSSASNTTSVHTMEKRSSISLFKDKVPTAQLQPQVIELDVV
eukprot:g8972.t1